MRISSLNNALEAFWRQHPALFYGLQLLLGFSFAFSQKWEVLLPFLVLCLPALFFTTEAGKAHLWRTLTGAVLLLASAAFVRGAYTFPQLAEEGVEGKGHFQIDAVSYSHHAFAKGWMFKGTLSAFFAKGEESAIAKNLSCVVFVPFEGKRPSADRDYVLEGVLKERRGSYSLKVSKRTPWAPVKNSFSLAEWRFQAKEAVTAYLAPHFANSRHATFITGLVTGEFQDSSLLFEFGRLGLQHIMAISGFHFSVLAAIASLFFRTWLPQKVAAAVLISVMTAYYLFVGSCGSVERAWVMTLLFFGGWIVERNHKALNAIGVALIIVLLHDPVSSQTLGFQFSFLTTAAILFFYAPCERALRRWLTHYELSSVVEMGAVNQHGFAILALLRQALAICIAVNCVALPLMLFYFHKFPLLSLLYNLFFPFLVSISMFLLPLSMLGDMLFSPLGNLLHYCNDLIVGVALDLTQYAPPLFDFILRAPHFTLLWLMLILTLLLAKAVQGTSHQNAIRDLR